MSAQILTMLPQRVTWARVESGFYVASRAGEFVGYVDQTPSGSFLAFDGRSTPVGRYASLEEAQRAVLSVPTRLPDGRTRRRTRLLGRAATVSGVVAGGVALTAGALAPYL